MLRQDNQESAEYWIWCAPAVLFDKQNNSVYCAPSIAEWREADSIIRLKSESQDGISPIPNGNFHLAAAL